MPARTSHPAIVRIWRGRTRREVADAYEAYNYEVGIKPLIEKAMGVQTLREDRGEETEFVTISYWESVDAMSRFTRHACGSSGPAPRGRRLPAASRAPWSWPKGAKWIPAWR